MKIAIVGYGLEGQAAYDYWRGGNEITICDRNEAVLTPSGVASQLGQHYLAGLDRFDLIVRSPNVHPYDITAANADNSESIQGKITSNLNEFLRVCPTSKVIGITGTKGKGTTSTLTAKMLTAAGFRVHLGGNIGVAPLRLLADNIKTDDWVVLELSSFQLIDAQRSPHLAACLMVVPEHLDWHADMDEYIAAKQQLFRWQTPEDVAVFYPKNDYSRQITAVSTGQKVPYYQTPGATVDNDEISISGQIICRTDELKLLGQHNWQNVCAALTLVWQVTQNVAALRQVATSFSGLEHRLEFVREVNGVKYYDDSFGTTPETAIVALQAFKQPKVIILGGSDKGASYDQLARTVGVENVRQVILIGNQGPAIEAALEKVGYSTFTNGGSVMPEIVRAAQAAAQSGDVVLLSTGCASFDLFKNYKDRGEQFKSAVRQL